MFTYYSFSVFPTKSLRAKRYYSAAPCVPVMMSGVQTLADPDGHFGDSQKYSRGFE